MTTKINNEHKKVYVPNLRFPEFHGEWEKCKLGDYGKVVTGNTPPTKDIENYENGTYLWASPADLGTIKSITETKTMLSAQGFSKTRTLPKGSVLVTCIGSTIGKAGMATKEMSTNQQINSIVVNDNNDNEFVYYAIQSAFPRYLSSIAVQAVPIISKSAFELLPNNRPYLQEQKKIGRFLSMFDERIATQNKIIDKLQSLIKGLEDNLLDNPLWEKTYLRSFMQFFSTNSLSWEQLSYEEGEIRNLHYGLIHGFQTRGINSASLPMIKNEAVPKQYISCQVGDVAFADASEDTGEIAKSVEFVDTIEGNTICGLHTIHGRDIKNRTVVGFKGFAFNSRYFHNQIKRLAQGTKVFSITANNLSSCYVYLPDLETQKAIVKLLKAYEAQLIVSRKTLKQYEKQKQYLLRQMFI
ncbi:restriction endonuclease subunit S [Prevotella sp.]|uniref:restriction endonuclease subunit S n=1 Tax=Prevotella sp. TaxID=59823 RepID=UPI00307C2E7E